MKAELRETWYNMCVWMVGFRRIVGPEKISVTCACSNVARRSFIREEQKGRVAWARSYSAKHPLPLQGWAKLLFPGLENFVPAVAYHFCLNLLRAFSQPGSCNLSEP